jgi:hypothetical protein
MTRLYIRQAALDGRLRIRGRHEIESAGQDRTNFSEIYTEIPSAYWKHSIINVLATGAAYETDRHTKPETVYAWGPKGLHETNCYAGLQLNSDDVSRLMADARNTGFSSDAPMSEKEEWISAATAVALLGMEQLLATRTICKRAHAGLIKARAERFIRDGRPADDVDVPVELWWAEGGAALDQNWTTGDFDTWIDQRIHLQAFGVTFRRSDIKRPKPAPLVENTASPALTPARALERRKTAGHDAIKEAESTPDRTTTGETGTVFISYSYDSSDHIRAVLTLSNRLRSYGIDCVLDQYESCPPEGWPRWMDRQISKAQFVLMICTEAYYRRVMGQETLGIGLGIAWEGNLIYNHLYSAGSLNTKFIPVLFHPEHGRYIPSPTQGATRYCVSTDDGYEQLYSRLTRRPPAEKPPLGKREPLPEKEVKTNLTMLVTMPIDPALWDKANWRATVFMFAAHGPPVLGLGFQNEDATRAIFSDWRERYGAGDEFEELRVSIVEGNIPDLRPGYSVHIGIDALNVYSRYSKIGLMADGDLLFCTSRINRMNAPNSPKLAAFKDACRTFKTYFLAPVIVDAAGIEIIKPILDMKIYKSQIHFRKASEIGENDPDSMVVRKPKDDDFP